MIRRVASWDQVAPWLVRRPIVKTLMLVALAWSAVPASALCSEDARVSRLHWESSVAVGTSTGRALSAPARHPQGSRSEKIRLHRLVVVRPLDRNGIQFIGTR
jgi:hypothetical protein